MTTLTLDIDQAYADHLASQPLREQLPELAAAFALDGYVEIESFAPPILERTLRDELDTIIERHATRRELHLAATAYTPRYYSNVARDSLAEHSAILPALYHGEALVELVRSITGDDVRRVPFEPEEFLVSRLHEPGDCHGWHWDDYAYALVWLLQVPPPHLGGSVQFVRGTRWDKQRPRVTPHLAEGEVVTRHPNAGSAYLLRSDTSMHRVTPIGAGTERTIVCFSFATPADLDREITHETMEEMYGLRAGSGDRR